MGRALAMQLKATTSRLVRRLFGTAVRNEELLGQPCRRTHPHLIASGSITPGHTDVEYRERRLQLAQQLGNRSMTVIPSYGTKYGSQNILYLEYIQLVYLMFSYPFQQNNNLLYLTGFDEPGACLVLERSDDRITSTLFLQENDAHALLWEGPRCGTERAPEYFGVDAAKSIGTLAAHIEQHLRVPNAELHHDLDANSSLPEGLRSTLLSRGASITFRLQEMRVKKQRAEIEVLKSGCSRSAKAFAETMRWSVQNRVASEHAVAARMEFECRIRGANGLAYVPVVASGPRALILHYTRNNMIGDTVNDIMFMDAGGKFDGYCTDISRAWPLSGTFTKPQKEIYEAVLRVQLACIHLCGLHTEEAIDLHMLNGISSVLFVEELRALGFKDPQKHINKLYPHSIGHYLGLDLHDCPKVAGDLRLGPGHVITIEPGLYIPEDPAFPAQYHGIGVRVEDDIVIEEHGCTVMTEGVPKEVGAIEHWLRSAP